MPDKATSATTIRGWHPDLYGPSMSDDEVIADWRRRAPVFTQDINSEEAKHLIKSEDVDPAVKAITDYHPKDYSWGTWEGRGRKAKTFGKAAFDSALLGIPELVMQRTAHSSLYDPDELEANSGVKFLGDVGGTIAGFGKIGAGIKALRAAKGLAMAPEAVALARAIEAPIRGATQGASMEMTRQMEERSKRPTREALPGAQTGINLNAAFGGLMGLPEVAQGLHIAKDAVPMAGKLARGLNLENVPTKWWTKAGYTLGTPALGTAGSIAGSSYADDPENWEATTKAKLGDINTWVLPAGFGAMSHMGFKHGWELPPEGTGIWGKITENVRTKNPFRRTRPDVEAPTLTQTPTAAATPPTPAPGLSREEFLKIQQIVDDPNLDKIRRQEALNTMLNQVTDKANRSYMADSRGNYPRATVTLPPTVEGGQPTVFKDALVAGLRAEPETGRRWVKLGDKGWQKVGPEVLSDVHNILDIGAGHENMLRGNFEGGVFPENIRQIEPANIPGLGWVHAYDKGPQGPPRLWLTDPTTGAIRAIDRHPTTGAYEIGGKPVDKQFRGELERQQGLLEETLNKRAAKKRAAAEQKRTGSLGKAEAPLSEDLQNQHNLQAFSDAVNALENRYKKEHEPVKPRPRTKQVEPTKAGEPAGAGYTEADFEAAQAASPQSTADEVMALLNAGVSPEEAAAKTKTKGKAKTAPVKKAASLTIEGKEMSPYEKQLYDSLVGAGNTEAEAAKAIRESRIENAKKGGGITVGGVDLPVIK